MPDSAVTMPWPRGSISSFDMIWQIINQCSILSRGPAHLPPWPNHKTAFRDSPPCSLVHTFFLPLLQVLWALERVMLVPCLRLSTMSIFVRTFWWTHTPISLDNNFRAELLHVRGGRCLALVHIISLPIYMSTINVWDSIHTTYFPVAVLDIWSSSPSCWIADQICTS